jgi:hypothetical protein
MLVLDGYLRTRPGFTDLPITPLACRLILVPNLTLTTPTPAQEPIMAAKAKPSKSAKVTPAKNSSGNAGGNGKVAKLKGPKTTKPAIAKPAAASAAKVKAVKPAAAAETYSVNHVSFDVQIESGSPKKGAAAEQFTSFAQARERAVDRLIAAIESAERRLQATRHAASFAEYRQSLGDSGD